MYFYVNSLLAFAKERGKNEHNVEVFHHVSRNVKIRFHCRGPQPPPRVRVLRVALCIMRLVLCQTRARRAKDRSLQAEIGVHLLPAQEARATLAL